MTIASAQDESGIAHQARSLWHSGQWHALISLIEGQSSEDAGHTNALLAAGAYLQLGNLTKGGEYVQRAVESGASPADTASVLLSCMHTCLGRISALSDDLDKARLHLSQALTLTGHPSRGMEHALNTRLAAELTGLGMLQDSGQVLKEEIHKLTTQPASADIDARFEILQSEIATLEAALVSANAAGSSTNQQSYSQLGQDLWVLEQTRHKRGGFFVEFGATDGILLSNTYLLETRYDWSGLLAEPNPNYLTSLGTNRHCTVTSACIGPHTGERVSFVLAKEYGGIEQFIDRDKHAGRRQAYADMGNVIEVDTISLNDFLLKHNAPREIDYLSIDTEGSELSILKAFPMQDWNIRCITIEHNNGPNKEPIRALLAQYGYKYQEVKWDDWFYLE